MSITLRATGVAVLIFALSGCASQSDNSALPSTTPSASASASPSPTGTPICLSSQLSIVPGRTGGAMGSIGIVGIVFKNNSTITCTLKGYPELQMLDSAGKPVTTHLYKGTSVSVQFTPEELVTLLPNGEAMFDLGYSSSTGYGGASCPTSAQVEVTAPNSDKPIIVPWKLQPYGGPTIAKLRCGEITVSPVYAPPSH